MWLVVVMPVLYFVWDTSLIEIYRYTLKAAALLLIVLMLMYLASHYEIRAKK